MMSFYNAFCRKDHALRNFSLHQAAAICDPKSFYREALAEGSSGLIALLVKELRPESLVYAINWIKRRAEGQPFPNDMAIRRHQTIAAGGGDVEVRAVMW